MSFQASSLFNCLCVFRRLCYYVIFSAEPLFVEFAGIERSTRLFLDFKDCLSYNFVKHLPFLAHCFLHESFILEDIRCCCFVH